MFYANVKYDILSWLNIAGRIRVDNTNTTSERKLHASDNQAACPIGQRSLQPEHGRISADLCGYYAECEQEFR